jgi:hypothetical protein
MGVDYFDISMTQQFLDGTNVIAVFEQVSGKTMAQGVVIGSCLNACGA